MTIQELSLCTCNLQKLHSFYSETLGCETAFEIETSFRIQIGDTTLTFTERETATPYHFAINIPSNQIQGAVDWLKQRVSILPGYGSEIVDFSSWKAKSVYFYDSDRNIVELISRERLNVHRNDSFDAAQFLGISEIGLPVEDIESTYSTLKTFAPFPIFSGSFDTFCAVGDDQGLFIIIDKNKKDWFPTEDPANSSDLEIFGKNNGTIFRFHFRSGKIVPADS